MTTSTDIINYIQKQKSEKQHINDEVIVEILYKIRDIAVSKSFINSLIFFYTQLKIEHKNIHLLSKREKEILLLIGSGKQSKEIAKTLDLTLSTIETHRKNIRKKLKLKGNGKLLQLAIIFNLTEAHLTI